MVVEFVAAVAVLVAAAALTELAPADGPLQVDVAAKSAAFDQHSPAGNLDVWLLGRITGEPDDRFTLTVSTPEGNAPEHSSCHRRVDGIDVFRNCQRPIRCTGARRQSWHIHTSPSRLGLSADWNLDVIVRRAGVPDESAPFAVDTEGTGLASSLRVGQMVSAEDDVDILVHLGAGACGRRRRRRGREEVAGVGTARGGLLLTMTALIAAGFLVTSYRLSIPVSASTDLAAPFSPTIHRSSAAKRCTCELCDLSRRDRRRTERGNHRRRPQPRSRGERGPAYR